MKMKTHKKILGIILAMVMVMAAAFVMTGCGDDVDPMELYNKASENMTKADDFSYDGGFEMNIKAEGQEVKMNADMDGDYIKSSSDDPTDLQMSMHVKMNLLNQNQEMFMYVKDGYTYTNDGTTKSKAPLDKSSAEQIKQLMDTDFDFDKYVKDSSMEGDVVKMTVDGKKLMSDLMKKVEEATGGNTGNAMVDSYAQIFEKAGLDEITIEAGIEDENFTSFKMDMPMKIDMGNGSKSDADFVINFSEIKVNTGLKEVEIPDVNQYK